MTDQAKTLGSVIKAARAVRGLTFDVAQRDCYETLAIARERGGVDLIITSPPYPDARTDAQYGAAFDTTPAGYGRLGDAVFEALRPGGVVALNLDGPIRVWRPELGESERSIITFKVAIDWAERVGLRYIERCVYAREGVPGDHGPRWRSGGELVHVFSKPGAKPYFNAWGYTLPAKAAGKFYSNGGARKLGGASDRGQWTQADRRMLSTVLRCSVGHNKTDRDHEAPFASELADAYVRPCAIRSWARARSPSLAIAMDVGFSVVTSEFALEMGARGPTW